MELSTTLELRDLFLSVFWTVFVAVFLAVLPTIYYLLKLAFFI